MCIHPSLRCLLLAFAWWSQTTRAADTKSPHAQRLLAALDAFQKPQAVLSVASQARTYKEGKEKERANVTALLPLDGSGSRVVLAFTPLFSPKPVNSWETNVKTTFNGRYWTRAIYDMGISGLPLSVEKRLIISKDVHPEFSTYRRLTALQLCLPFVRFQESGGWFSLRQLLEGYHSYHWTLTEEMRGDSKVLRLDLPSSEWLIFDPARNFVVLEHVTYGKEWRYEAKARKVEMTRSGLWFATDYVFTDIIKDKEQRRIETQVTDVSLSDKAGLEKELKPQYGRGWKVKDERTQEEYLIQDDAEDVFKKLDAVSP
jgi:hypothetical protein